MTNSVHHITGIIVIGRERDLGNMTETGETEKTGIVTGDTGTVTSDRNPHAGSTRTHFSNVHVSEDDKNIVRLPVLLLFSSSSRRRHSSDDGESHRRHRYKRSKRNKDSTDTESTD